MSVDKELGLADRQCEEREREQAERGLCCMEWWRAIKWELKDQCTREKNQRDGSHTQQKYLNLTGK